jgi:hypothetical protein
LIAGWMDGSVEAGSMDGRTDRRTDKQRQKVRQTGREIGRQAVISIRSNSVAVINSTFL